MLKTILISKTGFSARTENRRVISLDLLVLLTSLFFLSLFLVTSSFAGEVRGVVTDTNGSPIAAANVFISDTRLGASTSLNGEFSILSVPAGSYSINASHVGYTTEHKEIVVYGEEVVNVSFKLGFDAIALEELVIQVERHRSTITIDEPVRREIVTSTELVKSSSDGGLLTALSGKTGLNTRPCALCGSASIGMAGMDPNYTEINVDGVSLMSGLGALYGMYGVSVDDITQVEMVKGSGSSQFGSGAMAGAVNIVTRRPNAKPSLQFRLTGGETGFHALSTSMNNRLGVLPYRLTLGYSSESQMLDRNNDNLTDSPLHQRFNLGVSSQNHSSWGDVNFNSRFYTERRFAGDVNWTKSDRGSPDVYGREIFTQRSEATFNFHSNPTEWGDWSLESGYVEHTQDSWYGTTRFEALQRRSVNRLSLGRSWNKQHTSVIQGVFTFEEYQDNLNLASKTDRIDRVPGIVAMHNWSPNIFWNLELGSRLENYQDDGWITTVRGAVMYRPDEKWSFRLSGGNGYRPLTIFSLDAAVHAGFDKINLPVSLKPERSLNTGLTVSYQHLQPNYAFNVDVTGMMTTFQNMAILAFTDHHIGETHYSNADDGYSRSLEVQTGINYRSGWSLNAGGTITDVQYMVNDRWRRVQLQNHYTANLGINKEWVMSAINAGVTTTLFGPQTLPEGRSRELSPVYFILDANASKKWNKLSLTLSLKNLTDWVQPDKPLQIDPDNNRIIDAAMIYGPTLGRTVQLGLSWSLDL